MYSISHTVHALHMVKLQRNGAFLPRLSFLKDWSLKKLQKKAQQKIGSISIIQMVSCPETLIVCAHVIFSMSSLQPFPLINVYVLPHLLIFVPILVISDQFYFRTGKCL